MTDISDDYPPDVVAICTAYEAGFGDGITGVSKVNPYVPWSSAWFAWSYGVRSGARKRETDRPMPDGARRSACPACGWTFGTHAPHCTEQR